MADKMTPFNLPLGVLNDVGTPIVNNRITAQDSVVAVARQSQKIARSAKILKNISKFKAIVLRIKHGAKGPGPDLALNVSRHTPASWADRIFSEDSATQIDTNVQLIQLWARIPELHAALEPPQGTGANATDRDNWLIDQHDIFIAQSTAVPEPKPGDIVWVDYGNKNNFSDPIYIGPVLTTESQPTVMNKSTNSLAGVHSSGGQGCNGSTLQGSSPGGDSLPGASSPATTSMEDFKKLGRCFPINYVGPKTPCKGGKGQYIWWLYEHEAKHIAGIREYWLHGGNRARLKAYTIYAANDWIKKYNADYVVNTGLFGNVPKWQELAQIVWGVFYRECRWNPTGTLGGTLRNSPKRAIELNDTGYGMSQPPKGIRFDREKMKDNKHDAAGGEANNFLKDVEHWNLLDPKHAIDFTIIAYLRLFRKYGKSGRIHYRKGGIKALMNSASKAKNRYILGIWWAGNKEHKYMRKYNDIKTKGPSLIGGVDTSSVEAAMKSLLGGNYPNNINSVLANRPQPSSPPGGGKGEDGKVKTAEQAFGVWRAKAELSGVELKADTSPKPGTPKEKGGEKTQLPSTNSPAPIGNCGNEWDKPTDTPDHPGPDTRKKHSGNLSSAKLKIADIESKWNKGVEFGSYNRKGGLDQIVLHESISFGRKSTERILTKRNLGVHFIVDRNGGITQHVPIEKACSHAKGNNHRSVGIEIENPFFGSRIGKVSKKSEIIPVEWLWKTKQRGGYLTNTPEQLASVYSLILWICNKAKSVPKKVPGQSGQSFAWRRVKSFYSMPGIIPHNYGKYPHSDGLFAAHYMFLRLNHQLDHNTAYKKTINVLKVHAKKRPAWVNAFTVGTAVAGASTSDKEKKKA